MDQIFLRELKVETVIGIYDWERQVKQIVLIDLDMATDVARAAATDVVDDAMNYKDIAKRLITFVEASQFQLVETLAERIAAILMDEFQVRWVRVTLHKPGAIRGARDVGVMIERSQQNA